jgi:hypothetical protein
MSELAAMLCHGGGQDYQEGQELFGRSMELSVSLFGASHTLTKSIWESCTLEVAGVSKDDDGIVKKVQQELTLCAAEHCRHYASCLGKKLPDGWPAKELVNSAVALVLSSQILGSSHAYSTSMKSQSVKLISKSPFPMASQMAEKVELRLMNLVETSLPSKLLAAPLPRRYINQWTSILEHLRVLGGALVVDI